MTVASAYGMITWYIAATGTALFCGGEYSAREAWLAVPVEAYQSGEVQCGDLFAVWSGGELRYLPARDAGPFGAFCVMDGADCHAIVADLPRHVYDYGGLSAPAYVVNSRPARDRMGEERWP